MAKIRIIFKWKEKILIQEGLCLLLVIFQEKLWVSMVLPSSSAITEKKIERNNICDAAQSSGADISGIMSDSLRVALVKLRVCSNSDSSNSLLPRSRLSLNLSRFYPLAALIITLFPSAPLASLSFARIDVHPAAVSFRWRAVATLFNQ